MTKKSSVPAYRKHASGQARVEINGRTYYLGKYNSARSKQRYDALISEWLASNRSQSFGLQSVLMSSLMLDYLSHCRCYYPRTHNSETTRVEGILRAVAKMYSELPVSEFGPTQFKAVRERLVTDPSCQRVKPAEDLPPIPCLRESTDEAAGENVQMGRC